MSAMREAANADPFSVNQILQCRVVTGAEAEDMVEN
jgi:hypothetical protein